MPFTVQNDDGDVAGANALVTVAAFKAYHSDRGIDLSSYEDTQIEASIVKATDYMGARFVWAGEAVSEDTCWPRTNVFVGGIEVTGIPAAVKRACEEYALISLLGTDLWKDPAADANGRIVQSESSSVGPVSKAVTYATPGSRPRGNPAYPIADKILVRAGLLPSANLVVRA